MVIEILIAEGAPIDAKDIERKTALHFAAKCGNEAAALTLLQHGASVTTKTIPRGSVMDKKFRGGRTPLHWAARGGHEGVIRMLLDHHAEMNAPTTALRRPLQEACMHGHISCAKLPIEKGASVRDQDDIGYTALHEIARQNRLAIAESVLNKGPDIEAYSYNLDPFTPLLLPVKYSQAPLVQLLLNRGANLSARHTVTAGLEYTGG